MVVVIDVEPIRERFLTVAPFLDERGRRLVAAAEAFAVGYGGIAAVAMATGMAPSTIRRGLGELAQDAPCQQIWRARSEGMGERCAARAVSGAGGRAQADDLQGPDATPRSRGAGRTNDTRGSAIAVAVDLPERAPAGAGAAGAGPPSEPHPGGRTAQCGGLQPASQPQDQGGRQPPRPGCAVRLHQHPSDHGVDRTAAGDLRRHPKKELVGDFRNNGREYRPQGNPEEVRVHDFLIKELGRAVPYGIYDLAANSGWVSVGVDHDTAAFAVNSIRQWWQAVGRARYPNASRLLITADGGGSNGSRV